MSGVFKNSVKYIIIVTIMFYLLYDAFQHIDTQALNGKTRWQFISSYWLASNKWFIFCSLLCAILSHITRAMRWKLVLAPIGYKKISLQNATWAVLNGYFVNLFIPRGGELSRPISLQKTEGVPTDIGIGTVLAERIIDLIFLFICISTVMLFESEIILSFIDQGILFLKSNQKELKNGSSSWQLITLILFFVVLVLGSVFLFIFKKSAVNIILNKTLVFAKGIWEGIISISKLENRSLFVFYSILIWVFYYLMMTFLLISFEETKPIGVTGALTIFVVGGIAMAIPLPGGTGSYHIMVSFAISKLALISIASSVAIVTVLHGIHTVLLIILGGFSVYFIAKNTKYADKK